MNRDALAALKDAIAGGGPKGRPVDDVKEQVAADYDDAVVDEAFDYLEKTGEVYVVPGGDVDRVKLTARH